VALRALCNKTFAAYCQTLLFNGASKVCFVVGVGLVQLSRNFCASGA
jgi:hypothetical protein